MQGRNGELFGTSLDPYANSTGAAFDMTTKGTAAILYAFNPATGGNSVGGLTLATDGNYYGAADDGGTYNDGVLYRVSPTGTYTVLHDFNGADGSGPESPRFKPPTAISMARPAEARDCLRFTGTPPRESSQTSTPLTPTSRLVTWWLRGWSKAPTAICTAPR